MSRARNIKPGFFRNSELIEVSFAARLLFIGLWTLADREGRLECRPKQIKMELFPADSVDCEELIDEVITTGTVVKYTVDGKDYLQVVNFAKHQNPHHKEKASTIPAPGKPEANPRQALDKPEANPRATVLNPDSGFLIPDSLLPQTPSADEKVQKGKKAKTPPHTMPEDFWPNETGLQWARNYGVPVEAEMQAFRDWAESKGATSPAGRLHGGHAARATSSTTASRGGRQPRHLLEVPQHG